MSAVNISRWADYDGILPAPDNFSEYWRTVAAAQALVDISLKSRDDLPIPGVQCYELCLNAPDGHLLHAKFIRPAETDRPPAVLYFHDIPNGPRGWYHLLRYVALGCAVLAPDCRCSSLPQTTDEAACFSFLRQLYLDAALFANALCQIADVEHCEAYGEGVGGALALAASAMAPCAFFTCALNPLFADLGKEKLQYVDCMYFSSMLQKPFLLGTGMLDDRAPAKTQCALACLAGDRVSHLVFPKHEHERINVFEDAHMRFLGQHLL